MDHGHQGKSLAEECLPAEDKEPAWLKDFKDPKEREALVNTQLYKDWRATTTTLCSDLRWSQRDNNKVYPSRNNYLPWRTDRLPLFRGGGGTKYGKIFGRPPEQIFKLGFVPWDPTETGDMVIPSGSQRLSSTLINTGYNPEAAFRYGAIDGQIFVIDAPGGLNQSKLQTPHIDKNVVVFPGGIQSKFIKGYFYRLPDAGGELKLSSPMAYTANPNYQGSHPGPDEVDVIMINTPDPEVRLTHTPARYTDNIVARFKKTDTVTIYPIYTSGKHEHYWYVNYKGAQGALDAGAITLTDEEKAHSVIFVAYAPSGLSRSDRKHDQPTPELKSIEGDIAKIEWPRKTMVEFYHAAVWLRDTEVHGIPEYTAQTIEAEGEKMVATFVNLPPGKHTILVSAWGNAAERSKAGKVTINIPT